LLPFESGVGDELAMADNSCGVCSISLKAQHQIMRQDQPAKDLRLATMISTAHVNQSNADDASCLYGAFDLQVDG